MVLDAVLFDLDDTLFDQQAWLSGAWACVAAAGVRHGLASDGFHAALLTVAREGSDQGHIIDRALARVGAGDVPVAPLVEAFSGYAPPRLAPFPGLLPALRNLRQCCPIGLVSDGAPRIQLAKLRALQLGDAFDVVVLSDELGRQYRKPHPAPFRAALQALGAAPSRSVHIGDRPDKDVAGAWAAGITPVRVLTGEYGQVACARAPLAEVADVAAAISLIESTYLSR